MVNAHRELSLQPEIQTMADGCNLELAAYDMATGRPQLQTKPNRVIRVAVVQNHIVAPTTAPVRDQMATIMERMQQIVEIAAEAKVNIICFQEAWSK